MDWREHIFEIPLGVELPSTAISANEDWWDDCEEDDVFCLKPSYYTSKNKYNAALKLCRVCSGWFYFENEDEKKEELELLREILFADEDSPLNYYDAQYGRFDWLAALRENNEEYLGRFYDIENLWELFYRLGARSVLEKAACYEWFVAYFGKYLKYDELDELQNNYLQNYNHELEMILYCRPNQIKLLTEGYTSASTSDLLQLASAAAGLIRLGKYDEGLALYQKTFEMIWERKSTSTEREAVMDAFLERLSNGYENEAYIDSEISEVLEKQCKRFTDSKLVAKIKVTLARNKI